MTAFLVKTIMVFGFVLYMGGPMEAVRSSLEPTPAAQAAISDLALKSEAVAVQCGSMVANCKAPWLIMTLAQPASWGFSARKQAPRVLPRQGMHLAEGPVLDGCAAGLSVSECVPPGSKDPVAEKATAKLLFQSIGQ